jgi:hypothetical protein
MGAEGCCVVERPGLKPYRARKPPASQFWDDENSDRYGVVVLRTHDIERATVLAVAEFARSIGEMPEPFPVPTTTWLRLVPWGGDGGSFENAHPGERGAIPCVEFESI